MSEWHFPLFFLPHTCVLYHDWLTDSTTSPRKLSICPPTTERGRVTSQQGVNRGGIICFVLWAEHGFLQVRPVPRERKRQVVGVWPCWLNAVHGIADREKRARLLLFGPPPPLTHSPLLLSPGTERFQLDSFGEGEWEKEGRFGRDRRG